LSNELFVKLNIGTIKGGLISEIGIKEFAVLASIAAFSNEKGEAFPSQDTIAEMVGYSRKTITGIIAKLRKAEIEGEPVIRIVQEKTSTGRRNKYILSPKSGFVFGRGVVTKSNNEVTKQGGGNVPESLPEEEQGFNKTQSNKNQEQDIVFDNAKAVLEYFRQKYFETYDKTYQPNWGRDQKQITNSLLKNFTDVEIKGIINTVFEHYDKRWSNTRFPRPTIGQLCTWLGNEALTIYDNQIKQTEHAVDEEAKYRDQLQRRRNNTAF